MGIGNFGSFDDGEIANWYYINLILLDAKLTSKGFI